MIAVCSCSTAPNIAIAVVDFSHPHHQYTHVQVGVIVENYGSHYIRSVTIGDAIYQVIALTKEQMDGLKTATNGVKRINVDDWDRLYDNHLAPWKVRETGKLMKRIIYIDMINL